MDKEFVTYKIAKLLKELGFDESCFMFYGRTFPNTNFNYLFETRDIPVFGGDISCYAPLWQQAFDWLLKKYKLDCIIIRDGGHWIMKIADISIEEYSSPQYEIYGYENDKITAKEKIILKVIEIIKNK